MTSKLYIKLEIKRTDTANETCLVMLSKQHGEKCTMSEILSDLHEMERVKHKLSKNERVLQEEPDEGDINVDDYSNAENALAIRFIMVHDKEDVRDGEIVQRKEHEDNSQKKGKKRGRKTQEGTTGAKLNRKIF
jgi:hypothetical protein